MSNIETETIGYKKRGYLDDIFKFFYLKDKRDIYVEHHHHDFNKIVILISGKVTYLIEDKTYNLKPWDILFINKHEIHKPIINTDIEYERIVIWINEEKVSQFNTSSTNILDCFNLVLESKYNLLRLDKINLKFIKSLLLNIKNEINSCNFGNDILINSLFLELIIRLNRIFLETTINRNLEDVVYDKTIELILDYINLNLTEDLSIDTISNNFYISKYYLMHKFKEQTGSTIHNYIIQKRLIYSKELILNGSKILTACFESGFNDYSCYVRSFKKVYNCTPKKYFSSIKYKNLLSDDFNLLE